MANKQEKNTKINIRKVKLVMTIVERNKTEFYVDFISQFEVNIQTIVYGQGTADNNIIQMLGLSNNKGIIFSLVRDNKIKPLLETIDKKFKTIKNGKGVCVVMPISSVIGKLIYQLMINNREVGGENV